MTKSRWDEGDTNHLNALKICSSLGDLSFSYTREIKNSNTQGSFRADKERLVYLFNSGHRCQKNQKKRRRKKKTYQLSVNTAHFVTAGQHLVIDVKGQQIANTVNVQCNYITLMLHPSIALFIWLLVFVFVAVSIIIKSQRKNGIKDEGSSAIKTIRLYIVCNVYTALWVYQ